MWPSLRHTDDPSSRGSLEGQAKQANAQQQQQQQQQQREEQRLDPNPKTLPEKHFPNHRTTSQGFVFSPAFGGEERDNKETLQTTVASGNEVVETKSSIMEIFDTQKQVLATPRRICAAPSHAWASSTKTAPLSTGTRKASGGGGAAASGSVGGAERYGYLSFSEVHVEDQEEDKEEYVSWGSYALAVGNIRDSGRFGRDMLQRRLKKRARAWRVFLAVMQEHGLRVRKYHRRGKGWAHRVVKYDPSLPGLRWKTSKWWDSGGGQIPLRDVLDVERRGKVVWIKCLHLGTVGFEASLETDAVIFYLAMDSLLDKRCGVDDSARELRLAIPMQA